MGNAVEEINELGGFVTVAEAASVSRLSPKQVRHIVAHGRVRAVRVGGWLLMVEKRGLRRYVAQIERANTNTNTNTTAIPRLG